MRLPIFILIVLVILLSAFFGWDYYKGGGIAKKNVSGKLEIVKERPLEKYTYDALSKKQFEGSEILFGETVNDGEQFTSRMFYFLVEGKKVSGLANVPKGVGSYPVVLMLRGYVDREEYRTGIGTQRAGEVFAQNGFITLAPDFLGYGQSDNPSASPIEERFQTYTTVLTLLASLDTLNSALGSLGDGVEADVGRVGIWGHSNGGQIALTILEVSGKDYPTVLWAPVSKPFPYSILYYTDDFDDHGKMLRRVIADFESDYDAEKYSLTNYLDRIKAPLRIHQGTGDEAVPIKWSDDLVAKLTDLGGDIEYFTYLGADHNLSGLAWNTAVTRSVEFYKDKFRN